MLGLVDSLDKAAGHFGYRRSRGGELVGSPRGQHLAAVDQSCGAKLVEHDLEVVRVCLESFCRPLPPVVTSAQPRPWTPETSLTPSEHSKTAAWVSRAKDPSHGRRQLVSLTSDGQRTAKRLADTIVEVQDAVFGNLTRKECATLLALLERVARP